MDDQILQQQVKSEIGRKTISKIKIPEYITSNIKHDLWQWQIEALQYFIAYDDPEYDFERSFSDPVHLMFNMATGTGKTVLMASLILYYYKKGYRHFIFFVNQNNIVDKTENNFINKNHNKYLFKQNIVIDDKTVNIKKVESFDDSDDIQIKFTSIHKLHNAVYLAKENAVTLEDLQKRNLVMIGDEAHHFNASTMKNGQMNLDMPTELKDNSSASDVERSWENTVLNKILKKEGYSGQSENRNVLLEFTATIPNNQEVKEKYRTKTIYKYELIDFLNAGYTKEINLISTSLNKKEKILLALLFNWYRHKIALLNNIPNFKPVILFRSKYIEESKNDYREFLTTVKELQKTDFEFLSSIEKKLQSEQRSVLKVYEQGASRIKQMIGFINEQNIDFNDIISFIKADFDERNCIITNSKDNKTTTKEKTTEEQEQLLNSLEDKNNHIRAIFTVKRLTEGWDVLNLYDIVRLYEGRDEGRDKLGKVKAGQTTTQEIQLIGRGVRYYPFEYKETEASKRKFDEDLENPLRILEEFYFHSENDIRYLDELKRELKNKGFIQDNRIVKKYKLKEDFENTDFFKEVKVWKNERIDNPEKRKLNLSEIKTDPQFNPFTYEIKGFSLKEQKVDLNEKFDNVLAESKPAYKRSIQISFKEIDKHIIRKAINIKAKADNSILKYENLTNELNISSIDDIFNDKYLGDMKFNIITESETVNLSDISADDLLNCLLIFFEQFTSKLKEINNPYKGDTKFKHFSFKELFGDEKEKSVLINEESKLLEDEMLKYKWYVLNGFNGTSEERELLEFLKNRIVNLQEKYDEVYLLRNEEVYKIYDFVKGRGFEPDFLLFLKGKNKTLYYQIFIEPKGDEFKDKSGLFTESKEGWKEEFMKQISHKYGNGEIWKTESRKYVLYGLPLFNSKDKVSFENEFNKFI